VSKTSGNGNAELLRPRPVDIGVELRDIDLEAGKHRRASSGAFRLGHDGGEDVVQRVVALRGAVLDLQLEPPAVPQMPERAAAGR
jgi:hypothetical protein